jgi:hypothetical protein
MDDIRIGVSMYLNYTEIIIKLDNSYSECS